ncbi:MAG: hypothetical protein SOZ62_00320 [Eubacteriales bacterium]|nr:hypothetical protein [Eubacteriales bacterium]
MTGVYEYVNQDLSANPLFAKLRNRFMCQNNCTIGEVMLKRAENDGYKCSPVVSSSVRAKSNFRMTSEYYITRGSSLPNDATLKSSEKKTKGPGIFAIAALLLICAAMLAYLVLNRINYVKAAIISEERENTAAVDVSDKYNGEYTDVITEENQ